MPHEIGEEYDPEWHGEKAKGLAIPADLCKRTASERTIKENTKEDTPDA